MINESKEANQWDEIRSPAGKDRLYEIYHENSKFGPHDYASMSVEEMEQKTSSLYETFTYSYSKEIALIDPTNHPASPLQEVIATRYSCREFQDSAISLDQLSSILRGAYGLRNEKKYNRSLRVCPSAGALYPLEIYLLSQNVENLPQGLLHYNPVNDALGVIRQGDFSSEFENGLIDIAPTKGAPVIILVTGVFGRSAFKYGERAYRFVLMESGHLAQNINLVAHSLKLGSLNIGGFYDRRMDALLDIDGVDQSTLYLMVIGHPK